jgi:hypothetical protein
VAVNTSIEVGPLVFVLQMLVITENYFDVVVGLVWSHDPKSYAGGSACYW